MTLDRWASPISEQELPDYLRGRGLGRHVSGVEVLGGGISNIVLGAVVDGRAVVVKQALPRLRVADEWLAEQERAVTEAEALRLCAGITPGAVPEVLDIDEARCAMVLERAPAHWTMWKSELMRRRVNPRVAAALGRVVGTWHARTAGTGVPSRFADPKPFRQLRTDPYHRTAAARRPELAERLDAAVDALETKRLCLVHGDLSPKNVLVSADGLWVIDAEVAHFGNPAFDVSFLSCHLVMKAVHLPDQSERLRACADEFGRAYRETAGAVAPAPEDLALQLGALLVARVDGKSPAEYLTDVERHLVRRLGSGLLLGDIADHAALWDVVEAPGA